MAPVTDHQMVGRVALVMLTILYCLGMALVVVWGEEKTSVSPMLRRALLIVACVGLLTLMVWVWAYTRSLGWWA